MTDPAPNRKRRWLPPRPGFLAIGGMLLMAGTMQINAAMSWGPTPPLGETLKPVPRGFLWGVATAGYQWEGGDTASNWAAWEAAGKVKERSGLAADGWRRYEEDLDLCQAMGLNAFRMSLEWARIEPEKDRIDWQAVAHYHDVLRACRARGLEPIVTLVHSAYPAWLDRQAPPGRGAWESQAAVKRYLRYVDFVTREFGPDIRYYLTFNEPTVMVEAGYLVGVWPPGKKDLTAFVRASANVIRAHSRAFDLIHRNDRDAMVGFNNYAASYDFGLDPQDSMLPVPGDDWFLKAFSQAMIPKKSEPTGEKRLKLDFVAVDYYKKLTIPVQIIPPSPSQWRVHPDGFEEVLERYYKAFGLPILVAENGFATDNGRPRPDGWNREAYLVSHVAAVQRALARGVPVFGYTYWTLTDNYEWGSFDDRFGLYRVECRAGDYTRHETPAVAVYRQIAARGGVTPALMVKYVAPRPEGTAEAARP